MPIEDLFNEDDIAEIEKAHFTIEAEHNRQNTRRAIDLSVLDLDVEVPEFRFPDKNDR